MDDYTSKAVLSSPTERTEVNYDLDLLRKISNRDTSALSAFYDIHSKYLYTIIIYILKDESEAEDLLQEVFLQIWDKIALYDEALGNPLAWIVTLNRNKSIDKLRSKSFRNHSDDIDIDRFYNLSDDQISSNPENISTRNQEGIEILKALKSLNPEQRDLIEFAYFRGYSHSELSRYFQIPLGTVKTRLRAAIMLLRGKLKKLL